MVTEGAKKRDTGEERLREGEVVIAGGKTEEEKKRLEGDPFARLEEKVGDKIQASSEKSRIEELYRSNERDWDDPGSANARLRREFRVGRKERARKTLATEALQEKMGIGIELLEENEEDKRRAGLVDYGEVNGAADLIKAQSGAMFQSQNGVSRPPKGASRKTLKGAKAQDQHKKILQKELGANTRAAVDPFLNSKAQPSQTEPTREASLLLKRKRRKSSPVQDNEINPPTAMPNGHSNGSTIPLVDYDSD